MKLKYSEVKDSFAILVRKVYRDFKKDKSLNPNYRIHPMGM